MKQFTCIFFYYHIVSLLDRYILYRRRLSSSLVFSNRKGQNFLRNIVLEKDVTFMFSAECFFLSPAKPPTLHNISLHKQSDVLKHSSKRHRKFYYGTKKGIQVNMLPDHLPSSGFISFSLLTLALCQKTCPLFKFSKLMHQQQNWHLNHDNWPTLHNLVESSKTNWTANMILDQPCASCVCLNTWRFANRGHDRDCFFNSWKWNK